MFEPIAIVGRSCILPGADSPAALWDAVAAGRDLLSTAPADRWGVPARLALTDDPDHSEDRAWSDRGGYVTGARQRFVEELQRDPFQRDADDLLALDPLFHWVLQGGRQALREAGHEGDSDRVGAVLGNLSFPSSAMSRFAEHVWLDRPAVDPRNRFMSGLPALLLAEQLGLRGGAFALDAACASSLYAIKLACDQLHDRRLDLALAGAVCRSDDLFIHVGFCALGAMSRTGRSRPFHADADGLVPAEGAAFVALKRYSDALAAGDTIHGVIRGVGLSNDGRGRGLLAPDSSGQVRALRRAWQGSGLDPARLSLVECHATGTPVGDAAELQTLSTVLGPHEGLPLGSLKSNLGHLITAAGAAAVLKVLGAFEAGVRPPTLHADVPNPALADTPYRLLTAAEPWHSDGPRLAAINAFGFGGNNAHLILEEHHGAAAPAPAPRIAPAPIAVIGLGVRAPGVACASDLADVICDGRSRLDPSHTPPRGRAAPIELSLSELRFPPRDLQQTLPQQLLVLDAALQATAGRALPGEHTAVLIGSQSDPEVCRYGARWRLPGWSPDADAAWIEAAQDSIVEVLQSAGVVGNMPNIPANRIGSQLDLGGPGFTLAAEEHSGLVALQAALRMLRAGEIEVALAGAVDLSAEPVHEAAAAAVLGPAPAGDAAVVLLLKPLEAAQRDQDPILALIDDTGTGQLALGEGGLDLAEQLGRAHAATPLLNVAAAVALCATGRTPPGTAWQGERTATITSRDMTGTTAEITVRGVGAGRALPAPPPAPARPIRFPSHPDAIVLPDRTGSAGPMERMPAAPPLPPTGHDVPDATELSTGLGQTTGFEAHGDHMPLPPALPPITAAALASLASRPPAVAPTRAVPTPTAAAPTPAHVAVAHASPAQGPAPTSSGAIPAAARASVALQPTPSVAVGPAPAAGTIPGAHLAELAALHRQLSTAHAAFLQRQAQVHAQFLDLRQRSTQGLLQAIQQRRSGGGPIVPRLEPPPRPAPPRPAPIAPRPELQPPTAPAPRAVPTPSLPVQPPAAPVPPRAEPVAAPTASARPRRAEALPGPKFSRAQLERLASDKISEVLGPMFSVQDAFPRQVRMPEPPLLLADRVTGIDAEPGSMTTGTIWTETDVVEGAWYLHDGTMPAGAMIEAGQADLLLISWLGVDFRNRGERVYRLLGCQLIYSGGLPRPGERLNYEIHIDGHANVGETSIFFFHYDCVDADGNPRLVVREGQAGFFTDQELDESGGILWTPEAGEHDASARLDPPKIACTRSSFTEAQVLAFANGDGYAAFGPGFERLQTHVRTPRIAPPPMSFWTRVTALEPRGGPWGRGYLLAEQDITPEDWFFQGHFKDDPCMPGTMMFEACLQAMGFYMATLGYTVDKDGWSFEPVPDITYDLRCRGQVIPSSRHLTYELFVEEVHDGPWPTIYADVLCTIDGLKAFWARRVGLRLRPDWPLTSRPEVLADYVEPRDVATVDGFEFGYASLIACAWGKPSDAFGPMYRPFDEGRHCARLPGPPYHFMSRVTHIEGAIGGMEVGTAIELEYDIPPDAWYFENNGHPTMPFCVLLEAALQPCGWIACFVGSALTTDKDLFFRNLDGTATWHVECLPDSGTLTTKAKINSISTSGGMIIESFEVRCFLGEVLVYDMKTVFGFFPPAALANQIGIVPSDAERAALAEPCDFEVDLTTRPARYCGGALRLPSPMLLMLDRVTGFWPEGGKAGLGRLRSEKDVDPSEWFFKAHFYTDPVQPGSLGLEAMIQLLQFFMIERDLHEGMANPRFEPLMIGREHTWKYRGQVIPENKVIRCEIEITEIGSDDRGRYATCDAWLWVDELRIYQGINVGMRIVDDGHARPLPPTDAHSTDGEETLAPEGWITDHCPTYTLPTLPAMSMVDRLARAGRRALGGTVVELRDVAVHGWVKVDRPVRLRTEASEPQQLAEAGASEVAIELQVWRDRPNAKLSRFEAAASGVVRVAEGYPSPPEPWAPLDDVLAEPDPYASGALFHGPAFRYLTALSIGPTGSVAVLDPEAGTVPRGALHQGLLDAVLHAIPHDALHRWTDAIPEQVAAYPHHIESLRLYGPAPFKGPIRIEARYDGLQEAGSGLMLPRIRLQAIEVERERVWLELTLVEILLPKGPIGEAPGLHRLAFLRDRRFVPGLSLSEHTDDQTRTEAAVVRQTDWLPGTVAEAYRSAASTPGELVRDVAIKDHVAQRAQVHPDTVRPGPDSALSDAQPLTRWPIRVESDEVQTVVHSTGEPRLDLSPVTEFWDRYFGLGRWPVEDLYYGLIRRFIRRVHVVDPRAHEALRGRSLLYLGNHQVGVESLLFSILASGLNQVSTVTVAKVEHQHTWLGQLIAHCFSYPGSTDPRVITFFDREDKGSLPRIIAELAAEMTGPGKSVMVHVEGTRSLSCRTPVQKMSGAFLDMAIYVKAPVIPIRFVGALPIEPASKRLEYPVDLGQLDVWLGRPISPEVLAAMPYKERKEYVIEAINALGPPAGEEVPFPGDPAMEQRALQWSEQTGTEPPHSVLLELLAASTDPHPAIARLVQGAADGHLRLTDSPEDRWLGELARRLYGPRGPTIEG